MSFVYKLNYLRSDQVIDVSKIDVTGSGWRTIPKPKTNKSTKKGIEGLPIVSDNIDSYRLAVNILGEKYNHYITAYTEKFILKLDQIKEVKTEKKINWPTLNVEDQSIKEQEIDVLLYLPPNIWRLIALHAEPQVYYTIKGLCRAIRRQFTVNDDINNRLFNTTVVVVDDVTISKYGNETSYINNEYEKYYKKGRFHRDNDLPAVIYPSYKEWYRYGLLHRDNDKPAVEHSTGEKSYYIGGLLHRDNNPAVIGKGGVYKWYKHGKKHRDGDLPAETDEKGNNFWFRDGLLHRSDNKPAIEYVDGKREYYLNGVRYELRESITEDKAMSIKESWDRILKQNSRTRLLQPSELLASYKNN